MSKIRLCGGAWYINPNYLRSAYRIRYHPDDRSNYIGFRFVLKKIN